MLSLLVLMTGGILRLIVLNDAELETTEIVDYCGPKWGYVD